MTKMNNENLPLTFRQWILEYVPTFEIDKQSEPIVKSLGMWAFRANSFNIPSLGQYTDKGLLLSGPVGSGKSEVMRLLQKYVAWLKSPYRFNSEVVWKFAPGYKSEGYHVFNRVLKGNWYFDELALTSQDGIPQVEMVTDYGNKIFVGEYLIMMRYNEFKRYGFQTHFSTNCTPVQLEKIYGKRCFSRLLEMCNFLDYPGRDRRLTVRPTFHINENNYAPANPQVPSEQINIDLKEGFNSSYINFCMTGNFDHMRKSELISAFDLLKSFGIECAGDKELRMIRLDVETNRKSEVEKMANPITRDERTRMKQLKSMYAKNQLDAEEEANVWGLTKMIAVQEYFKLKKEEGVEKLFSL
jgi:hypothetical protein